jgi:hypothetical protein
MKKIVAICMFSLFAFSIGMGAADAGMSKRGWYVDRPGATCAMRVIVTKDENGRPVVKKIRVCR